MVDHAIRVDGVMRTMRVSEGIDRFAYRSGELPPTIGGEVE
jgi:hypothetical protein